VGIKLAPTLCRSVALSLCRSDATRRSHSLTRPAGRSPGTGAIWKGVAGLLPKDRQVYNAEAVGVDLEAKTVSFKDGSSIEYDQLVSTVPLDVLLRWTGMSNLADGVDVLVVAYRRHWDPRQMPARQQMLAVLSGGCR